MRKYNRRKWFIKAEWIGDNQGFINQGDIRNLTWISLPKVTKEEAIKKWTKANKYYKVLEIDSVSFIEEI
jgi:hypothetical protein